jgi:hypothetical protein
LARAARERATVAAGLGPHPKVDASARSGAGLGASFNRRTHAVLTTRDPLDRVTAEAGMIISRSRWENGGYGLSQPGRGLPWAV